MSISNHRKKLDRLLTKYKLAAGSVALEKKTLRVAQQREDDVVQAQVLVQVVAERVQESAHRQIASVVSRCLEAVFDRPYEFRIDFARKRGRTEANLTFVRDGKSLEDPINESGGGAIDIAAFALRLAALTLSLPKKRKLLVMDEPWKNLSSEYRPALSELVMQLAEEMNIQFLITTHSDEYKIGNVVELE